MLFYFQFGGFAGLEKLVQDLYVGKGNFRVGESIGPAFLFLYGFKDYFGFFWVVPETGGLGYFFFFGDELKLGVDVKGTSSALRAALIVLLGYQWLSWGWICCGILVVNWPEVRSRKSEVGSPKLGIWVILAN